MTIALFSDSYLPTKSGIVTVVVQLREQLQKLGHRVILVTVETTQEYSTNDPDIYRVRSIPLGMGTDQFLGVPVTAPLVHYIRENKVDLIHCHTEFGVGRAGIKVAKVLRIPAICTTHTMWVDFYKYYLPLGKIIPPGIVDGFMKQFYRKFNSLIGVSTKARNYFKQPGLLPKTPSVVIPNSIDKSKFQGTKITPERRHELRNQYGISDDDTVMLFVGRIGEEKRVFELLEAVKIILSKNPKVKMLFVGHGPAYDEMIEKAEPEIENKSIIFTGFIEWTKVHDFYESSDLFITASLSEMHSMTILEAQLSGLPIIVRNDESYLDVIIDNVNGYLCDSEEQMIEKVQLLIQDKDKMKTFGKNSLKITEKFTIETHVKRTLKVYQEVIKAYPKKIDDIAVMKMIEDL